MRQPAILRLAPFGAAALLALGACADDGGSAPVTAATDGRFIVDLDVLSLGDGVSVLYDLLAAPSVGGDRLVAVRVATTGEPTSVPLACDGDKGEYTLTAVLVGAYEAPPTDLGTPGSAAPGGALEVQDPGALEVVATCVAGEDVPVTFGTIALMRPSSQGFFQLEMHPMVGESVGDAVWDLSVRTAEGDLVSQAQVSSTRYGAGDGGAGYVTTCASGDGETPNVVSVSLLGVYPDALEPADRLPGDAAPAGGYPIWGPIDLSRSVTCRENSDVFLTFPVVVALRDDDGVHDDLVRVGEETVCDVAFSCGGEAPALEVACVAPEAPTILMDDLVVRCDDGGDDVIIDPEVAGTIAETAVDGGVESRWTVPVAVDAARLAAGACRVATRTTPLVAATDTTAGLVDGAIPAGLAYPMVAVDAALGGGASACEPARPEDGATASLRVVYSRADAATDTVFARASR